MQTAWELGIQGTKGHCGLGMEGVGGLRWSGIQLGTSQETSARLDSEHELEQMSCM